MHSYYVCRINFWESVLMGRTLRFIWVLLAAGCVYLGWTFYSRWSVNRAIVQQLEEQKAAKAQTVFDAYGGGHLKIMSFYASPGTIRPGHTAQLCYSVANSENVRIEPPVKNIWPSLSRCVEVAPKSDTVYKLIAEDGKGNTESASTTVKVR